MAPIRKCKKTFRPRRAFSLVELVMVVTIIGLVAAIAVPRMATAASHATAAALDATLTNVRKAMDIYYAEHGKYPGHNPADGSPSGSYFIDQLTQYTNERGQTNQAYSASYLYGPYLRRPFPKNPFNGLDTVHVKRFPSDADAPDGSVGWVAVLSHGYFGVSATDSDLGQAGIDILNPTVVNKFRGTVAAGL